MYVYMHTKVDTRHSRKFGKAYKKVDLESICFAHYIAVPSRSVWIWCIQVYFPDE